MKFGCRQCETVSKWLHDVKLMPPALWPCQMQIIIMQSAGITPVKISSCLCNTECFASQPCNMRSKQHCVWR